MIQEVLFGGVSRGLEVFWVGLGWQLVNYGGVRVAWMARPNCGPPHREVGFFAFTERRTVEEVTGGSKGSGDIFVRNVGGSRGVWQLI